MPTNEALEVFYGTLPLIVVLLVLAWLRERMVDRLKHLEER